MKMKWRMIILVLMTGLAPVIWVRFSTPSLPEVKSVEETWQENQAQDWWVAAPNEEKKIKKIALLAAHTVERDEKTGAIEMIDGGAWNMKNPGRMVGVTQALHNYPETVYSEYFYSRELAKILQEKLLAHGYQVKIIDPKNPDRNDFIRQSVAESYDWGADLIITLHTDGNDNRRQRGCFAIVDDRWSMSEQNAALIQQSLANIKQLTGIPLASQYRDATARVPSRLKDFTENGGILNTTQVGLNRLTAAVHNYTRIIFGVAIPEQVGRKLEPPPVMYLEVGTHSNEADREILLAGKEKLAEAISLAVRETYEPAGLEAPNSANQKLLAYTPKKWQMVAVKNEEGENWAPIKDDTLSKFLQTKNKKLTLAQAQKLRQEIAEAAAAANLKTEVAVGALLAATDDLTAIVNEEAPSVQKILQTHLSNWQTQSKPERIKIGDWGQAGVVVSQVMSEMYYFAIGRAEGERNWLTDTADKCLAGSGSEQSAHMRVAARPQR